jgi:hypothetical protein
LDTQFEPPTHPGGLRRLGKRASRVHASVPRLTTRHTVVQRIALLRRRQADLAHNFHNFQRNDIAIGTCSTMEQIADRGADLRLGVVSTAEIPIALII